MPIVLSRKGGLGGTGGTGTAQALSIGVSTGGNTAGNTTVNTGSRFVIVGSNGITASEGTAAGATTVTLSGITQSVQTQGQISMGVSTGGNTSGDTTVNTGTRFVLAGGDNITLSQATAAGATTVTISGGAGGAPFTHSLFSPFDGAPRVAAAFTQSLLMIQPYAIDRHFQHDRVVYPVNYTQASNSTLTVSISAVFGLYTRNASTLSLASSSSGSFSINGSGTASSAANVGQRALTFGWTNTVSPNDYWLGMEVHTATAGANGSFSFIGLDQQLSNWSGVMGVASNASAQYVLGLGSYSASTSALPASIAFSQVQGSNAGPQRPPLVWFLSESA